MSVTDYVGVMRRNLALILVALFACSGLALWSIRAGSDVYRSEAQMFVSGNEADADISGAYTNNLFVQQRVPSYVAIVGSTGLLTAVADDLGPGVTSPTALSNQISAENPPNTALLNVSASAATPADAQHLLTLVTSEFVPLIDKLETPNGAKQSVVQVTVIKTPTLPTSPTGLSPTLRLGAGLVLGLLVGLGAALIRNSWDTRLHTADEAEHALGLRVLGQMEVSSRSENQPFLVRSAPTSTASDDPRRIRTALEHRLGDGPHRIAVVGAVAGEGASTVASNLAAALAEGGTRVVLVEGDLRSPRLADRMGVITLQTSLWLVSRSEDISTALIPVGEGLLRVMPAPTSTVAVARTLGATSLQRMAAQLDALPDVIVFDSPPILDSADAAILASAATHVLFVARVASATRGTLESALGALSNVDAAMVGMVLTKRRGGRRLGRALRLIRRRRSRSTAVSYVPAVDVQVRPIRALDDERLGPPPVQLREGARGPGS